MRTPLPCGCVPHETRMSHFGTAVYCETEQNAYCNFECPHEEDDVSEHRCTITDTIRDTSRFTAAEAGVYGDGCFGAYHVTARAVRLAHQYGMELGEFDHLMLIDADMDNGYSIGEWGAVEVWDDLVDEAVDYLNEHAVEDDVFFEFSEGDFRLSTNDETEEV